MERLTVRVDSMTRAALEALARERGCSLSAVCRERLEWGTITADYPWIATTDPSPSPEEEPKEPQAAAVPSRRVWGTKARELADGTTAWVYLFEPKRPRWFVRILGRRRSSSGT